MNKSTESYWFKTDSFSRQYPSLNKDITVDVAIIGGGITGITAAYLLKQKGKKVAVVEQNRIAQGETGHTTGHLTYVLDTRYSQLISDFGRKTARLVYESKLNAILQIVTWIHDLKIDCNLKKVSGYLYSSIDSNDEDLYDEKAAYEALGIFPELTCHVPLPFPIQSALKFKDQYQMHASKYVHSLASFIEGNGSYIFENTHAIRVDKKKGTAGAITTGNGIVHSQQIVIAANSPSTGGVFMGTKVAAYRSYAIATRLKNPPMEEGLYWDNANPYHYIRKSEDLWIIGGEDHKTGQIENTEEPIQKLENFIEKSFGAHQLQSVWSGQIIEPVDGLPFIGFVPGFKNRYLATGFSGNGLTFGTLAGILITDLIEQRENPFTRIYDPNRFKVLASVPTYLEENKDFPVCFIKDRLQAADVSDLDQIKNGTGATVQWEGQKLAVFRDESGCLRSYSCVCPHQGCHVHWNQMEKTWDCPCHGSRFDTSGKVLNGPSLTDLKPVQIPKKSTEKAG